MMSAIPAPAFRWRWSMAGVLIVLAVVLGVSEATAVSAQAAGTSYVLASAGIQNGVVSWDTHYTLSATTGPDAAGVGSSGANYSLLAGFAAVIDPPVTGVGAVPWPMAVRPWLVDFSLTNATPLALIGAELDSGGAFSLKIGGRATTVQAVTKALVSFQMPSRVAPGFHDVEMTSQTNRTAVVRAVGVRPMLELARPAIANRSLQITVHAHPGDVVWLAASFGPSPWLVTVPPFFHEFQLDPVTFIFLGSYPITAPTGSTTLLFLPPGITYPVVIQGLVMSGGPSGYAPGSFTNVLSL